MKIKIPVDFGGPVYFANILIFISRVACTRKKHPRPAGRGVQKTSIFQGFTIQGTCRKPTVLTCPMNSGSGGRAGQDGPKMTPKLSQCGQRGRHDGPRGPPWGLLGASWGLLAASWGGRFELSLQAPPLGPLLGPSWGSLGPSWAPLGPFGGPLGPSWGSLRLTRRPRGLSWSLPGALLSTCWAVLGRSWEPLGPSWAL